MAKIENLDCLKDKDPVISVLVLLKILAKKNLNEFVFTLDKKLIGFSVQEVPFDILVDFSLAVGGGHGGYISQLNDYLLKIKPEYLDEIKEQLFLFDEYDQNKIEDDDINWIEYWATSRVQEKKGKVEKVETGVGIIQANPIEKNIPSTLSPSYDTNNVASFWNKPTESLSEEVQQSTRVRVPRELITGTPEEIERELGVFEGWGVQNRP